MQAKLGPTSFGLRAPKERLLRDIAHARVLVRECILLLMRDHDEEQQYLPDDWFVLHKNKTITNKM